MKTILAIALLAVSLSAQAVDITITLTTTQATRVAAACGVVGKLKDAQVPPQPRACTMAEAKQFLIQRLKQLLVDVEGPAAEKARGPVVLEAFDPS
jgi:hypothetical protein